MTRYAAHWRHSWIFAGALGIALSFLVWSPAEVLGLFLTSSVCAALLIVMFSSREGTHETEHGSDRPWWVTGLRSCLAGGAVVALGALVAAMPYLVVPVLLVAALTSPWVVARLLPNRSGQHPSEPGQPGLRASRELPPGAARTTSQDAHGPGGLVADDLSRLSDRALCHRWRESFADLHQARSAEERSALVELRQRCLDEMERRSPAAFAAWLASGARASGGLERFLAEERYRRPDAA